MEENVERKLETPTSIYISYATKDSQFLEELKVHLMPFVRNKTITIQEDSDINAGELWDDAIKAKISKSDIILYLVSADFINSVYHRDIEFPLLKERRKLGKNQLIPIILRFPPKTEIKTDW